MNEKRSVNLVGALLTFLVFALPALDVALIVRVVYVASVPDLLSPFWAIFVGLVLGVFALIVGVFGQGNTVVEIVVPALILLGLILIMLPVAHRAAENRHAKQEKARIHAPR